MAEPIKLTFGLCTPIDPCMVVLHGVHIGAI